MVHQTSEMGRPSATCAVVLLSLVFSLSFLPTQFAQADSGAIENECRVSPQGNPVGPLPDPGPDIPPVGRSLFDYLYYSKATRTFVIPNTMEALLADLKSRNLSAPKAVLIPKGRSLQRKNADFQYPRVVLAIDDFPNQTPTDFGLLAKDRLYIGFEDKTHQLEVISFNAAAARFEYQVVTDFEKDKTPKVFYAPRTLCLTCHQGQAPIFSCFPWSETNSVAEGDDRVAKLISAAHPPAVGTLAANSRYMGVPIFQNRGKAYNIDSATDRANLLIPYQQLWMDSCGRDAADGAKCRGHLLRFALDYLFSTAATKVFNSAAPEYAELKGMWARNWPIYFPNGLSINNPNLLNRDPFAAPAGGSSGFTQTNNLSDSGLAALQSATEGSGISPETEPARFRNQPEEVLRNDASGSANRAIFGVQKFMTDKDIENIKTASAGDLGKIVAAIERLVAATKAGTSDVFANKPFRRGTVISALLKQLASGSGTATSIPSFCCEEDHPDMIAARLEGDGDGPATETDNAVVNTVLKHFSDYCVECHKSGSYPFLKGNDRQVWWTGIRERRLACEIYKRLNWNPADPDVNYMPQDGSNQRMNITNNLAHKTLMMETVIHGINCN